MSLRQPAWVERVVSRLDGVPTIRLMVILRAPGCVYARRPEGGCAMCGFKALSTGGISVAANDLLAQLDEALARPGALDGVSEIDLYNSGSFFAEAEIPADARAALLDRLAAVPRLERLLVEARAEHVDGDKLRRARAALGGVELEVGIGLEAIDDHLREVVLRKGITRADFGHALATLARTGTRLLVYVLVKPPTLDEQAAIEEAVATAEYVFTAAAEQGVPARVALEPTFVAPGCTLDDDFRAGRYTPPSLWSVVEIVRRLHPRGEVIIGLSDEGLDPARAPAGCPRCTPALRQSLADYNRTGDVTVFDRLECECRRCSQTHAT